MPIALDTLLKRTVLMATASLKDRAVPIDKPPTTIRLNPSTRLFLEAQAEALNTSVSSVISSILDSVATATTKSVDAELQTIRARFFELFQAHDFDLPGIVAVMRDHGFSLATLGNEEKLLELLTSEALAHLASTFHVRSEWLSGRSAQPLSLLGWYKNSGNIARLLLRYADEGLEPKVILVRRERADFERAVREGHETLQQEPVGVLIRLSRSTHSGVRFSTYHALRFEHWGYEPCRHELKELILFCEEAKILTDGREVSEDALQQLALGQLFAATLRIEHGQHWHPDHYATLDGEPCSELDDWRWVRDAYQKGGLRKIAARVPGYV